MLPLKKKIVTDEAMRPVAVLIDYQDWQQIEKILSRWVEKFTTMSLRVKLSQMNELQELCGFYISLHSSVFLSLPT